MKSTRTWAHLHLPKLTHWRQDGQDPNVISIKMPGHRVRYTDAIWLRDVVFHVNERGRERAVREHVRNVHAWVVGEEVPMGGAQATTLLRRVEGGGWRRAVYSPFKGTTFVDYQTHHPVLTAREAVLVHDRVWYR